MLHLELIPTYWVYHSGCSNPHTCHTCTVLAQPITLAKKMATICSIRVVNWFLIVLKARLRIFNVSFCLIRYFTANWAVFAISNCLKTLMSDVSQSISESVCLSYFCPMSHCGSQCHVTVTVSHKAYFNFFSPCHTVTITRLGNLFKPRSGDDVKTENANNTGCCSLVKYKAMIDKLQWFRKKENPKK